MHIFPLKLKFMSLVSPRCCVVLCCVVLCCVVFVSVNFKDVLQRKMQAIFGHMSMTDVLKYSAVVTGSGGFQATLMVLVADNKSADSRIYNSFTGEICALKKAAEQSAAEVALSSDGTNHTFTAVEASCDGQLVHLKQ